MTDQYPITPPPDLIHNWCQELKINGDRVDLLLVKAARWGAEAELDACCEWLTLTQGQWELAADLRAARRPKPPRLAEEALARVKQYKNDFMPPLEKDWEIIRRALEALQKLEGDT